jgi:hypothetical protein
MIGPRDITGAAGACATSIECLVHRGKHSGMLAHAQIIVRNFTGTAGMVMLSPRKGASLALEVGKNAIPPLAMKAFKLPAEINFIVHDIPVSRLGRHSVPSERGTK